MPLASGDKLGPYEVTSRIGVGGMGEVYRAHDSRLNREVAIKISARTRLWALTFVGALSIATIVAPVPVATQTPAGGAVSGRASQIHRRAIVVDTHDDTTQRLLFDKSFDIGRRDDSGSIDVPRMREGGLDALFFSIWMPGDVTGPLAVRRAMALIDSVHEAVRRHPADLVLATTAADIRRAAADGKIAALMGMEGGHMIDDGDSSGDTPKHNGLTRSARTSFVSSTGSA